MSVVVDPAYFLGRSPALATLRKTPEDFEVQEVLGFEPDQAGDHALLLIRKRNTNTDWLARQIGRLARVKLVDVGYCGLKDRNAVTTQWFSVNLSGQPEPDWSSLNTADVQLLRAERHRRKLKRGAHRANRFVLALHDLEGDRAEVEQRLQTIARDGVPNYFGEQRFGHDAGNLARARAMLNGAADVRDRHQRSIYLSAARSHLFNLVLSQRVADGSWNQPLAGDAFVLDGTHSYFVADQIDDTLRQRIAQQDIHPSGPLWGKGEPAVTGAARVLEQNVLAAHTELRAGLERAGLEQERRALRLRIPDLAWEFIDDQTLRLAFTLPPGAYATTVLREIVRTR